MEIKDPQDLLNSEGCLMQEGWARHQIWRYDRHLVAKPYILHKEWNRFLVIDRTGGWIVLASASQIGGKAIYSILYADLRNGTLMQKTRRIHANDKTRLPLSSDQDDDIGFSCSDMRLALIRRGDTRNIMLCVPGFEIPGLGMGIDARFELHHSPNSQSFTVATAFSRSRKSFLLNEIETSIPVSGTMRQGNDIFSMSEQDNVVAISDWGRGRFTTKPMVKALFCGRTDDSDVGISVINKESCALTVDGVVHEIEGLKIRNSKDSFRLEGKNPKIEFTLKGSTANDHSHNVQVFGYIEGTAVLEDGRKLNLNGIPGMVWQILDKQKDCHQRQQPR